MHHHWDSPIGSKASERTSFVVVIAAAITVTTIFGVSMDLRYEVGLFRLGCHQQCQ